MRNNSISAIRAIATCMIVCCHILQGLNNEMAFWVNVGVQIFLCMSGYLYGKKNIDNVASWYIKQYSKIMIPMWVVLTVVIVVSVLFQSVPLSKSAVLLSYLGVAGFGTLPELTHTWFITYILICYFITPLLQQIDIGNEKSNYRFVIKLSVVLCVLEILYLSRITNILPQYIACYVTGYYFAKRESTNIASMKKLVIFVTVLMLLVLPVRLYVQYACLNVKITGWEFARTQVIEWHHSLLGVTLFFVLLYLFQKIQIDNNVILRFMDKYSYSIYLIHQIFILNTFSLLHFTGNLFVNILIIVIVVCSMAFALEKVSNALSKTKIVSSLIKK